MLAHDMRLQRQCNSTSWQPLARVYSVLVCSRHGMCHLSKSMYGQDCGGAASSHASADASCHVHPAHLNIISCCKAADKQAVLCAGPATSSANQRGAAQASRGFQSEADATGIVRASSAGRVLMLACLHVLARAVRHTLVYTPSHRDDNLPGVLVIASVGHTNSEMRHLPRLQS